MLKTNQLLLCYFYKCAFIIENSIKDILGRVLEISLSPGISCLISTNSVTLFLHPAASHWYVPEKGQTQEYWGPFPDTPGICHLCTAFPRLAWPVHNLHSGFIVASLLLRGCNAAAMDKAAMQQLQSCCARVTSEHAAIPISRARGNQSRQAWSP